MGAIDRRNRRNYIMVYQGRYQSNLWS